MFLAIIFCPPSTLNLTGHCLSPSRVRNFQYRAGGIIFEGCRKFRRWRLPRGSRSQWGMFLGAIGCPGLFLYPLSVSCPPWDKQSLPSHMLSSEGPHNHRLNLWDIREQTESLLGWIFPSCREQTCKHFYDETKTWRASVASCKASWKDKLGDHRRPRKISNQNLFLLGRHHMGLPMKCLLSSD